MRVGERFAVETRDHYLVSDHHGRCTVIEFLDGKIQYHSGQGIPIRALTNSTYAQSIRAGGRRAFDSQIHSSLGAILYSCAATE